MVPSLLHAPAPGPLDIDQAGRHRPGDFPPRGRRRAHAVITAGAVAIGLWLGLTAPSVSPVAPAAPPPGRTSTQLPATAAPATGTVP